MMINLNSSLLVEATGSIVTPVVKNFHFAGKEFVFAAENLFAADVIFLVADVIPCQ